MWPVSFSLEIFIIPLFLVFWYFTTYSGMSLFLLLVVGTWLSPFNLESHSFRVGDFQKYDLFYNFFLYCLCFLFLEVLLIFSCWISRIDFLIFFLLFSISFVFLFQYSNSSSSPSTYWIYKFYSFFFLKSLKKIFFKCSFPTVPPILMHSLFFLFHN